MSPAHVAKYLFGVRKFMLVEHCCMSKHRTSFCRDTCLCMLGYYKTLAEEGSASFSVKFLNPEGKCIV